MGTILYNPMAVFQKILVFSQNNLALEMNAIGASYNMSI